MRSFVLATFLLGAAVAAGAGCTAAVVADPYPPDLVYAAPGVQVIANYNEPIFYSGGLYWRYYGGVWYRSSYYTGGWVYARPPVAVMGIHHPHSYVYYRPPGWHGHARTVAPAPAPGWRGTPSSGWRGAPATPPPSSGWRGAPATPPASGWRGAPPPGRSYSAPRAAPAPGRGGGGGGWRGSPR